MLLARHAKSVGLNQPDGPDWTLARGRPVCTQALKGAAATALCTRFRCSDFIVPPAISYGSLSLPYFQAESRDDHTSYVAHTLRTFQTLMPFSQNLFAKYQSTVSRKPSPEGET